VRIKVEKLTPEAFSEFGSYVNVYETDKNKDGDLSYYADQTAMLSDHCNLAGFSVCGLNKRPMRMDILEIHEHTEEAEFIVDGDCALMAGGRSGYKPDSASFKAFLIPKGTLVRFKKFVWHFAPFPVDRDRVMALTVLPPFTYTNDTIVVKLEEAIELEL